MPRRPWLVALAAGVGIGVVLDLVFVTQLVTETMLLDWPGVACLVLVVAVAFLQWSPAGRVWRTSDATVAPALLAVLVLVQRATRRGRVSPMSELRIERRKWLDGPHHGHHGWPLGEDEDEHGLWIELRVGCPSTAPRRLLFHGTGGGLMAAPTRGRWLAWAPPSPPRVRT